MKENEKSISFRIDEDTRRKFAFVCKYEGRSINGQLLYLAREAIRTFEADHGLIVFEDKQ